MEWRYSKVVSKIWTGWTLHSRRSWGLDFWAQHANNKLRCESQGAGPAVRPPRATLSPHSQNKQSGPLFDTADGQMGSYLGSWWGGSMRGSEKLLCWMEPVAPGKEGFTEICSVSLCLWRKFLSPTLSYFRALAHRSQMVPKQPETQRTHSSTEVLILLISN